MSNTIAQRKLKNVYIISFQRKKKKERKKYRDKREGERERKERNKKGNLIRHLKALRCIVKNR